MAHAHLNLLKPFTRQTVQTIRDILTRQTRPPESVSYDAVTRRYLYKGERERIVEINRAHAKKAMVKAETAGTAGRLDEAPREAAVLLPLVNFRREDLGKHRADQVNVDQGMSGKAIEHGDIVPGILFQVRAGHMRMHAGEVSSVQMTPNSPLHHRTIQSDQSLYDTALRETSEELGIDPEQVEFVGRLGPGEISLGGLLVHVFIGYVHPKSRPKGPDGQGLPDQEDDMELGSLPLSSLRISEAEVLSVLPLPFSYLIPPSDGLSDLGHPTAWTDRLTWKLFRGEYAYRTVSVGDLLVDPSSSKHGKVDRGDDRGRVILDNDQWKKSQEFHGLSRSTKVDGGHMTKDAEDVSQNPTTLSPPTTRERLEVWGLTGWFLSVFMWRMGFWRDVVQARGRILEVERPRSAERMREAERSTSRL